MLLSPTVVRWVCIRIGNSSGHIEQTHSRFPDICGCFTLNEMHLKLTSLIICLTNDNLIKAPSTPPPLGKNSTV